MKLKVSSVGYVWTIILWIAILCVCIITTELGFMGSLMIATIMAVLFYILILVIEQPL
jgi:hypothetical protein